MVEQGDQLHRSKRSGKKTASVTPTLDEFVPDLAEWARSWRYEERDIAPGGQIVACFRPFLQHLLDLGLSRKTRNRHRDNLWRLGGELIRAIQENARLRKQPIPHLIASMVGDDGGPLLTDNDFEEDQASFDLTCRKLARFLASQAATSRQSA
jgi:hypothetical protein